MKMGAGQKALDREGRKEELGDDFSEMALKRS
jgi:hypothetical protein